MKKRSDRKKKIYKNVIIFSVFAIFAYMFTVMSVNANESNENTNRIITDVVSDGNYNEWDLQWQFQDSFYDVLISINNGTDTISYSYDSNFNRIQKKKNDVEYVKFGYDDNGNLLSEQYENIYIQYLYDFNEDLYETNLIGFIYEGKEYTYEYTESIISGIIYNGNQIAKYTYDGKICEDVLELCNGKWVSNNQNDFIGNINKMRYKGFYLDEETGWYYVGRYFDPVMNRFIDGINMRKAVSLIEQYKEYEAEILLATNFFGVDWIDKAEESALFSTTSYGEVETVARVLFAESNCVAADQLGVAWVIYNRKLSSSFPNSAYEVVVQGGQFSGYGADQYYNPTTTSALWTNAVNMAVRLVAGNTPGSVPSYYYNQVYFRSIASMQSNITQSGTTLYYGGSAISKVSIIGYGNITSTSQINSNAVTNMRGKNNVFFSY